MCRNNENHAKILFLQNSNHQNIKVQKKYNVSVWNKMNIAGWPSIQLGGALRMYGGTEIFPCRRLSKLARRSTET